MDNESRGFLKIQKSSFVLVIIFTLALGAGFGGLSFAFLNGVNTIFGTSNTSNGSSSEFKSGYLDSNYINDVLETIRESHIGDLPDSEKMTYGAVKGIVESLDDPYTSFLDPEEAKQYIESRNPDFEGIGVTLQYRDKMTQVETVLSGYPAERSGIRSGDIVLEVDGEDMQEKLPSYVATKIRGEKGTSVYLKIYRTSENASLDFSITREKIDVSNITSKSLGEGIYQIKITQFVDESPTKFNENWNSIVKDIKSKGDLKGIVMDLRGNPGGYVYSVKYVLEEFLKDGDVLMSEEQKDKARETFRDNRKGDFESIPVSVILNEGSASASEIFAAAIQDNGRGKVVGKKSVGKGVEQQVIDSFGDESMLILVFQKWLTPSGKNIDKNNPILPDFEIDLTNEDVEKGIDPQLDKAKELVR